MPPAVRSVLAVIKLSPTSLRFVLALLLSAAAHLASFTVSIDFTPPSRQVDIPPPLHARLEQARPPAPAAVTPPPAPPKQPVKPKPKPVPQSAPAVAAAPAPVVAMAETPTPATETPPPPPALPEPPPPAPAAIEEPPAAPIPAIAAAPAKSPPRRIDLVYNAYRGSSNFLIGRGSFRLEHDGASYQISTRGEARGLLALVYWGQLKQRSAGKVTPNGLEPSEYSVELGGPKKLELSTVDPAKQEVILRDGRHEPYRPPIFDPLSVLLQFYFAPPTESRLSFRVVTTRKLDDYVFERVGEEKLSLTLGEVETQHWRRVGQDINGLELWLAPRFHYMPVQIRLADKSGNSTAELKLDALRVEDLALGDNSLSGGHGNGNGTLELKAPPEERVYSQPDAP